MSERIYIYDLKGKIIFERETVFASFLKDSFSIFSVLFAQYLNNEYLGNGIIVQFFCCVLALSLFLINLKKEEFMTEEQALDFILKKQKKEDTKDEN